MNNKQPTFSRLRATRTVYQGDVIKVRCDGKYHWAIRGDTIYNDGKCTCKGDAK